MSRLSPEKKWRSFPRTSSLVCGEPREGRKNEYYAPCGAYYKRSLWPAFENVQFQALLGVEPGDLLLFGESPQKKCS